MRRIAIVADELYPFTAGGIGRLNHNLLVHELARSPDLEIHLLLPLTVEVDALALRRTFGDRVFHHTVPIRSPWHCTLRAGALYPPPGAFSDTPEHAVSLDVALKLMDLESKGLRFDWIEFADYLGRAFCTLQEKRLGRAFQQSKIAVRLHSTHSILQRYEPPDLSWAASALSELERKSLLDADLVVGHLASIAEANRNHFGFSDAWLRRVSIEFPPVVVDLEPGTGDLAEAPDLVFASKLQRFKRPDLFVRGAVLFMLENPDFTGDALLACHVVEGEAWAQLRRIIPEALAPRFRFVSSQQQRLAALRTGIVVVPSDFESLNLLAYEAAHLGGRVVLNGACAAFGAGSPFEDGRNATLFDGSVDGLAAALARAWKAPPRERVRWECDLPYWNRPAEPPVRATASLPLVSVIITNFNLSAYLPEALFSVAASTYPNVEVIIVDDCSTSAFDREAIAALTASGSAEQAALRIVQNKVNRGLPASRNVGIRHARGAYVLPLDADDRISPDFIQLAVRALENQPEHDVVVPTVGYFDTDGNLASRRFIDYAVFLGDVPSHGLLSNRFSTATSLIRKSLFDAGWSYDERLTSFEDWDLYLRLSLAGTRFLVTNDIQFHYRRRPGSMIHAVDPERHLRLLAGMYDNLPRALPPSVRLRSFLTAALPPNREPDVPLRHLLVDSVNATVKRVPLMHWTLKFGTESLLKVRKKTQSRKR